MIRMDTVKDNLDIVEGKIQEALRIAGRKREEIKLVVVTKTHSSELVKDLLELGVRDIGESYVQEALKKQIDIAIHEPGYSDVQWHMIGHVQSRKAAQVAENFAMIHSVDSLKLARRLNQAAYDLNKTFPVLIQVNISGEQSKFGFAAANENEWHILLNELEELTELEKLNIQGLMSIPPFDVDNTAARKMYSKTRKLRDYFQHNFPDHHWGELSMGMSGDFESGIKEGATILRLGSVILGTRSTN